MMVPRAYQYSSPPTSPKLRANKSMEIIVTERAPKKPQRREVSKGPTKPARMLQASLATPSAPVIIPTRTQSGRQRRGKDPAHSALVTPDGGKAPHDPQSIPSSVAALLAVTSLPESRYEAHQQHRRRVAHRGASGFTKDANASGSRHAISTSSPRSWGVLQSPPNELDPENMSAGSDMTTGPLSSIRSLSSESMPSLDTDAESICSASNPSTPGISMRTRSGSDRKQKTPSSSVAEDCILDHPLLSLPQEVDHEPIPSPSDVDILTPNVTLPNNRSTFKSNLTASLRLLKSAARSFSNFTAPVQRDDYLARSLFSMSPQYTDERRPLPSTDLPVPALRRYLNPITVSPAEFYRQHDHSKPNNCTASIQLQTYQCATSASKKSSSPPIFISNPTSREADQCFFPDSTTRQREPRENSDFLRVVVLEMNMRKVGKLSDTSLGRARLWLPARQVTKPAEDKEAGTGTPRRWVSLSI